MNRLLPPSIFPRPHISTSSTRKPKNYRVGERLFSLLTTIEEANGQPYTLQVAQDRSTDDRFTKEFGALVAVVLAFGILASILIAITITKRGLRPLAEMTRSLGRIGPTHLNERVSPAGWPRELQPLAVAFDPTLKRLDDSSPRLSQPSAAPAHDLRTPT